MRSLGFNLCHASLLLLNICILEVPQYSCDWIPILRMISYILIKNQKDRKLDERWRFQLSLWGECFLFENGLLSGLKYCVKTTDSEWLTILADLGRQMQFSPSFSQKSHWNADEDIFRKKLKENINVLKLLLISVDLTLLISHNGS